MAKKMAYEYRLCFYMIGIISDNINHNLYLDLEQEQPIVQQPVQQQVQDVELLRIPQELQCPQCKLTVSGVIMITSMALKSLAEADVTLCPCLKLS